MKSLDILFVIGIILTIIILILLIFLCLKRAMKIITEREYENQLGNNAFDVTIKKGEKIAYDKINGTTYLIDKRNTFIPTEKNN